MRERCEAISCIHKEALIKESQRLDVVELKTVTLAVPVNERDHVMGQRARGLQWSILATTGVQAVNEHLG
jgi:hypothetical protein